MEEEEEAEELTLLDGEAVRWAGNDEGGGAGGTNEDMDARVLGTYDGVRRKGLGGELRLADRAISVLVPVLGACADVAVEMVRFRKSGIEREVAEGDKDIMD